MATEVGKGVALGLQALGPLQQDTAQQRSHVAEWLSDALSSGRPGFETSAWPTYYNP
jgi:hypothetical protein